MWLLNEIKCECSGSLCEVFGLRIDFSTEAVIGPSESAREAPGFDIDFLTQIMFGPSGSAGEISRSHVDVLAEITHGLHSLLAKPSEDSTQKSNKFGTLRVW